MRPNTARKLSPGNFLTFPDDSTSPGRYRILRRKIITLMILVTVAPLSFLSFILYRHYKKDHANVVQRPLFVLADKGKQTVDLFFKENLTAISFIASLHSYVELSNADDLNRVFHILKQAVGGIVAIGVIDVTGRQVNYEGPHDLSDKDYTDQKWFQETLDRGGVYQQYDNGFTGKALYFPFNDPSGHSRPTLHYSDCNRSITNRGNPRTVGCGTAR